MRTTSIVWPEATLGCPLRSAWRASVKARFASASLNANITTYAANYDEEKRLHEAAFVWSLDQFAAFETFYNTTLLYGMRWFMMDFVVAGVMVPTYSHITGGYRIGDNEGWTTVSFAVESYRRRGLETA